MEADFVRWLRDHLPAHPCLRLGAGDDAAVLAIGRRADVVVTTDLLSDGVDFRLAEVDPRRVGRKALAVNLSDLAAMAAQPIAAVISVALPRSGAASRSALELAIELYEGILPLATEFELAIAGGDTNTHDGPLVISATALGEVGPRGPLTRAAGQPGDQLLVTGTLGGSLSGRHLDFTPRVDEAITLFERYDLHAGIDTSDGLAIDAARLAAESGCGAVIRVDQLPISDAARRHPDPRQRALGDGEDFELLLAVPPATADAMLRDQPLECPITRIGELVSESGLWQERADHERSPLEAAGWQH